MDDSSCTNPAGLRARLLGRTEIALGDHPIPDQAWPRRSMRSLLLLLLASPGRRLPRDQVLESLWPDSAPKTALNALYVAVHGLRRTLEPHLTTGKGSSYVDVSGDVVGLRPGSIAWIDVDEFETELAAATGSDRGDAPRRRPRPLRRRSPRRRALSRLAHRPARAPAPHLAQRRPRLRRAGARVRPPAPRRPRDRAHPPGRSHRRTRLPRPDERPRRRRPPR